MESRPVRLTSCSNKVAVFQGSHNGRKVLHHGVTHALYSHLTTSVHNSCILVVIPACTNTKPYARVKHAQQQTPQ